MKDRILLRTFLYTIIISSCYLILYFFFSIGLTNFFLYILLLSFFVILFEIYFSYEFVRKKHSTSKIKENLKYSLHLVMTYWSFSLSVMLFSNFIISTLNLIFYIFVILILVYKKNNLTNDLKEDLDELDLIYPVNIFLLTSGIINLFSESSFSLFFLFIVIFLLLIFYLNFIFLKYKNQRVLKLELYGITIIFIFLIYILIFNRISIFVIGILVTLFFSFTDHLFYIVKKRKRVNIENFLEIFLLLIFTISLIYLLG